MEEGKDKVLNDNNSKEASEIQVYPDPDDPPLIQKPQPEKDEKQSTGSPTLVSEEENLVRSVLYFKNPFDAMNLPATATVDDINKKYKKVLVIHFY